MPEVRRYVTAQGRDLVDEWLVNLDATMRARVLARLDRVAFGNFGHHKALGGGISELRFDIGRGLPRALRARRRHGGVAAVCGLETWPVVIHCPGQALVAKLRAGELTCLP
ncbi:MAG: putative addiction module killer protein [Gammaproteobacteria bacterium]|jgi:putative addiction module killer protein